MKLFIQLVALVALALPAIAQVSQSKSVVLMVGISTSVPAGEVDQAVKDLNMVRPDPTTGTMDCSFEMKVTNVYPAWMFGSNAIFSSVALVNVTAVETCGLKAAVAILESSEKYILYSNPNIEENPGISGSTRIQ